MPPRVQKRASEGASELKPRKYQENPKNARGPEWHPEENAKKQDARPKGARNQVRRDKQKRKQEQAKQVRVGVSCYYLIFLSQKKREKQKRRRRKT